MTRLSLLIELYDFLIRELLDFMKKSSIIAEFIE